MYKIAFNFLKRFFSESALFKHGFNLSPMYRRSVGKLVFVSKDLYHVQVEIPLNYKNRNYVGAIFGGSMFSATDPIYMIQLIQILGNDYVVWDKAVNTRYKRPAKGTIYGEFIFTNDGPAGTKTDHVTMEIDIPNWVVPGSFQQLGEFTKGSTRSYF